MHIVSPAEYFWPISVTFLAGVPILVLYLLERSRRPTRLEYASFDAKAGVKETIVVDCLHPSCPTLTHHKGGRTPLEVHEDTSGGIVLKALKSSHPIFRGQRYVTCNHYDIDGLVAVFAATQPLVALSHEQTLRTTSVIGDLRELDLSAPHAREALLLCTWSNSVERDLFYRPFDGSESDGCDQKYQYFLPRLPGVLEGLAEGRRAEDVCAEGLAEYTQVVEEYHIMQKEECVQALCPEIGLAILTPPHPLHYYALFSRTIGYDTVLTIYPGNRYELECKYSGYIDITSRPVWPRLDLSPLVKVLNAHEEAVGVKWSCSRFTDSGPVLRLDSVSEKLTKAQRYGNPYERPIFTSNISPSEFTRLVMSYFSHGLRSVEPKNFWKWEEIHRLNRSIKWDLWESTHTLALKSPVADVYNPGVTKWEAVVVLGCNPTSPSLRERVVTAVTAWQHAAASRPTLLVTTGWDSQSRGESEAETMAGIANELGVPLTNILVESQACNTLDNALRVRALLERLPSVPEGLKGAGERRLVGSVTVVTSDWHIPRARLAFDGAFQGSKMPLKYSSAVSSSLSSEVRCKVEKREASGQQWMLDQLQAQPPPTSSQQLRNTWDLA
uniref:DUF218 domain-containing protein n=1 Tax=Pyramimonas obovata TaxID=1411642 RepID=A0A7S0QZF8_9CHLO